MEYKFLFEDNGEDLDELARRGDTVSMARFFSISHQRRFTDNPPDPIVVKLWSEDPGKEETDSSLPPLKYHCPKCRTTMTKREFEEWARHGGQIKPGYHVYHRGYNDAWDCGPLKMYDPKTDFGEPLYAHHCVYKGVPIESEEHLAEIKAKEARGEPILGSESAEDERRYMG